jgi:acyl-CoA thioesterase II
MHTVITHRSEDGGIAPSLPDLLELDEVDRDRYRSTTVIGTSRPLYGGQVAAQALKAAGLTVPPERVPHSLHGYYLRRGDSTQPISYQVGRDRDGRSYSARRIEAVQQGEVIFSMAASFHVPEDSPEMQSDSPLTDVDEPANSPTFGLSRLVSMDFRVPEQPFSKAAWPTRLWARCTAKISATPLENACVITYLSDMSSGLTPLHTRVWRTPASLDHAVWFHQIVPLDNWVLLDLVPHRVASGRGWYTGAVWSVDGVHSASLAQEMLFRASR